MKSIIEIEGFDKVPEEAREEMIAAYEKYMSMSIEEKLEHTQENLCEAVDMLMEQSKQIETLSGVILGAQEFCKEAVKAMLEGTAAVARFLDNHEDLVKAYLESVKNIKMH